MKISSSANAHAAIVGLANKFALRNAKFFWVSIADRF
jgi:hypothetical protein